MTADRTIATAFLNTLITAVLYKIHTILTDTGSQFSIRRAAGMVRRRTRGATCLAKAATGMASNTG